MGRGFVDHRYELLEELGSGASATVFLAEDHALRRRVALKLAGATGGEDGERLRREFELLGRLDHPHLPRAFAYGRTPEGRSYFTLELVAGRPLDAAAPELSEQELALVLAQGCSLLDCFGRWGLVHGDLTPSNLIVARAGDEPWLKVIDLGLGGDAASGPRGLVRGTPRYAAPSILDGEPPTSATDLHALGASFLDVVGRWEPAAGGGRVLGRPLLAVLERLVARDPDVRYRNAGAALADLEALGATPRSGGGARFVGRGEELAAVREATDRLLRGPERHVALVTGEPEIGKSALLLEWQRAAEMRGALVVPVSAGGTDALGPWTEALRHLLLVEPEACGPERPGADDAAAWEGLLARVARRRPLLVLVEDAQRLDEASLRLLERLAASRSRDTWAAVLAVRTGGEGAAELVRLAQREGLERIALEELDDEASEALVATLAPGLEPPVRRALARATGGRPGFLVSAARWARAHPEQALERWLWEGMPARLAADVEREIDALEPPLRAAAIALSVLARPFGAEVAAALLRRARADALEVCGALAARGVLARAGGPDERFELARSTLRLALLERLDEPGRRAQHARALAALVSGTPTAGELAPALLEHALGAEDAEAVPRHAEHAVAALLAAGAPREARVWLGRVGRFLAARGRAPGPALAELEGDVRFRLGELEAAQAAFERALGAVGPESAAVRVRRLHKRSRALAELGRFEEAHAALRAGLALAREPSDVAELCATGGLLARRQGDASLAERLLRDGLRALGEGARSQQAASLWNNLGVLAYDKSDLSGADEHWRRALAIHEGNGDALGAGRAWANLGSVASLRGRLAEARAAYESSLERKERAGDRRGLPAPLSNLAKLDRWTGRFGASIERDERVLRMREDGGDVAGAAHTHASLSSTWLEKGELGRARHHAERAVAIAQAAGERDAVLIDALYARAAVEAAIGREARARAALEEGLAAACEARSGPEEGRCLALRATLGGAQARADAERSLALLRAADEPRGLALGLVAAAWGASERGELDAARRLCTEARAIAEGQGLAPLAGRVSLCEGRLARARGEPGEASRALFAALDRARELGMPELEWRTGHELALACEERGQRERAVRWLHGCLSQLERLLASLEGEAALQDAFLAAPERAALLARLEDWLRA